MSLTATAGDHPRSRGVYRSWPPPGACPAGSSPLARGLPVVAGLRWVAGRIIPARAGFTSLYSGVSERAEDHPRSRGVYPALEAEPVIAVGSSPLARGLRARVHRGERVDRIIPARAGFTPFPRRIISLVGDHPRSRGVYPWLSMGMVRRDGSSPLARGLPGGEDRSHGDHRIIPARAGFTR